MFVVVYKGNDVEDPSQLPSSDTGVCVMLVNRIDNVARLCDLFVCCDLVVKMLILSRLQGQSLLGACRSSSLNSQHYQPCFVAKK
jgi:hypothetical protein